MGVTVRTAAKLALRICFFLRCSVFLSTEARGAGANQAVKAWGTTTEEEQSEASGRRELEHAMSV
jgi:hypothetical protein